MKKKQIKHESYQDADSIKQYLQQIIDGIDQGKISMSSGEDSLMLKPHGLIEFVLNASQSKSRQQLRFKMVWTPQEATESQIEDDDLIIE